MHYNTNAIPPCSNKKKSMSKPFDIETDETICWHARFFDHAGAHSAPATHSSLYTKTATESGSWGRIQSFVYTSRKTIAQWLFFRSIITITIPVHHIREQLSISSIPAKLGFSLGFSCAIDVEIWQVFEIYCSERGHPSARWGVLILCRPNLFQRGGR